MHIIEAYRGDDIIGYYAEDGTFTPKKDSKKFESKAAAEAFVEDLESKDQYKNLCLIVIDERQAVYIAPPPPPPYKWFFVKLVIELATGDDEVYYKVRARLPSNAEGIARADSFKSGHCKSAEVSEYVNQPFDVELDIEKLAKTPWFPS